MIRGLTARGKSVIFITHKLNEVLDIADRITVLRRGKLIETLPAEGATEASLARLMVGREVLLRVEKTSSNARHVAAPGRGPSRPRRPRHREGPRHLVRGAGRRDRRHGRHRRERPDGADRRARRAAVDRRRDGAHRRRRRHARLGPRAPRGRARPHPRGPPAPRARARVLDRREHRAPRLPLAARVAVRLALPAPPDRARPRADQGLRRARRRADHARGRSLRRKPAEGRARPRDRARPQGPDRRAAHARPRRRRDRVRAPQADRGARRGTRDPAGVARARGGGLPLPTGSS